MNRKIRISDGTMFTVHIKGKDNICNINLDFMDGMRDRFVLPDAIYFFAKNPFGDHFRQSRVSYLLVGVALCLLE